MEHFSRSELVKKWNTRQAEVQIAEAVRECERIAIQVAAPKSIGRDKGRHHQAGAQHAARQIRNRWPEYFKEADS
jgi:hypothetical protein